MKNNELFLPSPIYFNGNLKLKQFSRNNATLLQSVDCTLKLNFKLIAMVLNNNKHLLSTSKNKTIE